jgi:hypothetical protein
VVNRPLHAYRMHSISSSAWAKACYQQQRAKGKLRNTVIRALAFKWIRMLFRCWTIEVVNVKWGTPKKKTCIST